MADEILIRPALRLSRMIDGEPVEFTLWERLAIGDLIGAMSPREQKAFAGVLNRVQCRKLRRLLGRDQKLAPLSIEILFNAEDIRREFPKRD